MPTTSHTIAEVDNRAQAAAICADAQRVASAVASDLRITSQSPGATRWIIEVSGDSPDVAEFRRRYSR